MLYGKQVIELMAAYPGRPFVMREIIRYINPKAGALERAAVKIAVQRVMATLHATGNVAVVKPLKSGGTGTYTWQTET
jgi:hypothetical protein